MTENFQAPYWTEYLRGATATQLAVDQLLRIRGKAADAREIMAARIDADATAAVRAQCEALGIGLSTLANAACARLLASYAGNNEVLFLAGSTGESWSAAATPLRARVDTALPLRTWLTELQDDRCDAAKHPYAQCELVNGMASALDLTIHVDVCVSSATSSPNREPADTNAQFVIWISVGREIELTLSYPRACFDIVAASEMLEQLQLLLVDMGNAPDRLIWEFAPMRSKFARRALYEWNATEAPFDRNMTMHGLFEQQAKLTPHRVAVSGHGGSLTYAELESSANRLANYLIAEGVSIGDRIGLCMDKATATIVAILAVMKTGAAYVPIDPMYPTSRINYMVEDAGLSMLLTLGQGTLRTEDVQIPRLAMDLSWDRVTGQSEVPPQHSVPPDAFAYVIYTSGSTGQPKGVMLDHRGRVNNVLDYCDRFDLNAQDTVLCVSSLSFDISVCNIFTMLSVGGRIIFPQQGKEKDPDHWLDLISSERVTFWHSAPALLDALLDAAADRSYRNDSLRISLLGGDWVPLSQPARARAVFPRLRFVTAGGATELSIDSTIYEVSEVDSSWLSIPYGRPLTNQSALILDANLEIVPIGVPGELHLGGVGMAAGYLGRAALTAEKFIPHPWPSHPGERLYRTGDLARYGRDGLIELLGRMDFQVKIRGVRIELGEIEATLRNHPLVAACLAGAPLNAVGERRLCAYIVPADPDIPIDEVALQAWLRDRLPDGLVPEAFVTLDRLPLTPNGKVDRRNLPAIADRRNYADSGEALRTETECTMAKLWSKILRNEALGRTDHFFALGGHSIHAVRLLSCLRSELGIDVPMITLFSAPILHEFADAIDRLQVENRAPFPPISPIPREAVIPLSFAQRRLWFVTQLEGASEAYHIPTALRLHGQLNEVDLRQSLQAVFERHETLRMVFRNGGGEPQAIVLPPSVEIPWRKIVLPDQADDLTALQQQLQIEVSSPFNLSAAPPIRAALIRLGETDHVLAITQHHIASDGWSTGVLLKELGEIYSAKATGRPPAIHELSVQYADYAAWQRQWLRDEYVARQVAYWRRALADVATFLPLETDHPRPTIPSFRGAQVPVKLDPSLTHRLKALSLSHDATVFMTLMAAWGLVLGRLAGCEDLVIGTPAANRGSQDIESLIGFFVSTLPIRIDLRGAPSCASLINRLRQVTLEAHAHQDLPFEQIVEIVNPPRRADCSPLFQVALSWQNTNEATLDMVGIEVNPIHVPIDFSKFDLELNLSERNGVIEGTLDYATDLFDSESSKRFVARFIRVLEQFVENPNLSIDALDIGLGTVVPAVLPTDHGGDSPLSWHQERLYFIERFEAGYLYKASPTYHNIPLVIVLDGTIDMVRAGEALADVVDRHEVLRTRLCSDGPSARMSVSPDARTSLDERLAGHNDAVECAILSSREPFDLHADAPLIRATLFRSSDTRALLSIVAHHLIADRQSMRLIAEEWLEAYASRLCGQPLTWPRPQIHFSDYATWQRRLPRETAETALAYWRRQLQGPVQPMELSLNRPRMAIHVFEEARHAFPLTARLVDRIYKVATALEVTPFAVFLAGFNVLLRRYSGNTEVVIGTNASCRDIVGAAGIVGPIANLLVQRNGVSTDDDLASVIRRVHQTERQGRRFREMQFDKLVSALNPEKDMSRTALFDVLFDFDERPAVYFSNDQLRAWTVETNLGFGKYDLHLHVHADVDGFVGKLVYNKLFFDAWFVEQMMANYVSVLEAIGDDYSQPVGRICLLDEASRERQIAEWNDTAADYDTAATIHSLFEAQVEQTPDRIAVSFEGEELSYGALNERANRIARALIARGVASETLIPLVIDRSVDMISGMLGVLKADAAYLPIDPAVPDERIRFILDDCSASLAIVSGTYGDRIRAFGVEALTIGDLIAPGSEFGGTNPSLPCSPCQLAYIIYTSGSMGTPKGALLEHRNVVRLMRNASHPFAFGPDDVWSMFHSYTFDFSVWEIYGALLYGGRITIVPETIRKDPEAFLGFVIKERVSVLNQTPSAFHALSSAAVKAPARALPNLRYVIFGGEALGPATLAAFHETFPHVALVNMYGITETCVHVTFKQLHTSDIEANVANIGRPIPTTTIYITDEQQNLLPIGIPGEICVGGEGVGRGYLNRPELTAERFVEDLFAGRGRLYRSGDLGKLLPNGEIVHLGRIDDQIKLRGFRIEPGEIQAAIASHPMVREATVIVRNHAGGSNLLIAYVTVQATSDPNGLSVALRDYLAARLPEHMVPAAFVVMDVLPLTVNGKINRKALPDPGDASFARGVRVLPSDPVEVSLASLWSELLGVGEISRHDNFFALGGHSLLAVRLISRIRDTFSVELRLADLFMHPTLIQLGQVVSERGTTNAAAIKHVPGSGSPPLSFGQQRLWFLDQLETGTTTYLMPLSVELKGTLNIDALRRSLDALFDRHDVLRSIFNTRTGEPHVRLLPVGSGVQWRVVDLTGTAGVEEQLAALEKAERRYPFDLGLGPLIRACLVRLPQERHRFMLTLHHIVSDGWSTGILISELGQLYVAFNAEQPNPLPALSIQYADYAHWQRRWLNGERLQSQVDYWRRTLMGAPALLQLPYDRPRPASQPREGALIEVKLDAALSHAVRGLSQRHGATPFITVLAAWAVVLGRMAGQDDIVIGTPSANRGRAEIEPLIGFFVNTLALRINLAGNPDVSVLMGRARQVALDAQDHQDVPFEQVVEALQPPRRLEYTPIFQVMFAWQSNETAAFQLPDIHAQIVDQPFEWVKFDLELSLTDEGECIAGKLAYASALFDAATMTRYRDYLIAFLRGMTADENRPIRQINILSTDERKRLLSAPNGIGKVKPSGCCIHEHFERHARERPAMVAVVHGEACLSYAQLNDKANILAHRLIRRGVRPDNLVGLCVARSIGTVVGILAILKAGGAYVPLDPAYPADRLAHALNDAAPAVIVLDEVGRQALGGLLDGRQQLNIDVDTWKREDAEESVANPNVPGLSLTNLAYVIYTSGSTGLPKGVMVEHAHVDRLFESTRDLFNAGPDDVWSLFHSYAFDFSVWEMWGALRHGGRLLIVPEEIAKSGPAFYRLSREQGVTMLNQTPSAFRSFIHAHVQHATSDSTLLSGRLRHVIFGGEALDPSTLKPWYEHEPLSRPRLVNMYGITETTVHVTHREIKHDDVLRSHSPVGHVLADLYVYLLDVAGQPVPWGAPGELYVGGAGVARGYLNRPELTAERFLVDPFSPVTGARIYRTGDVGRLLPDGQLEFLGRNDDQVKIRGFRIELGEVRAALETHPLVKQSVIDVQQDFDGDKRLVAYVVGSAIDTIPPAELVAGLRAHLLARLPEHMVPAAFVRIAAIPLTPSGKLDLKALPHPTADAYALASFQAPESELEQFVACVWEQVLGVERVGRNDHFFELGGHSLLAVRMLSRVEDELDLHIPLTTLFGSPTVARFTEKVLDRFAMQLESVDATYESTAEILGKDEL